MNFFKADKSTQYVSVEESSECSEDQLPLRRRSSSPIVSVSRSYYFISLLLFAIFPVLVIALFVLHTRVASARIDSGFLKGFPTELGVLASETVRFTGGLHFYKNGTLYREVIEGQPQYVGPPSPEIDAAWKSLLKGQYMNLVGSEASSMVGRTWKDSHGNYEVACDAYPPLRGKVPQTRDMSAAMTNTSKNKVRMALDPDYYKEDESPRIHRMHVDHCLDYLRQTVQCHGDLTPMVFSWSDDAGRVVADWKEPHTCRNFNRVRSWAEDHFRP
ncbi:hypothetical protein CLIM01_03813 [Colletotrichum limetticola]|uniref:Tat pathway signal sequence n=1 Tax=Colletotrichum limetticola TaxID=1209924 RepID=A0ABQ9Q4W7_9PEZI|nr:hypothetical protein CLIM01_03813 [Colletotrichum limetticola]